MKTWLYAIIFISTLSYGNKDCGDANNKKIIWTNQTYTSQLESENETNDTTNKLPERSPKNLLKVIRNSTQAMDVAYQKYETNEYGELNAKFIIMPDGCIGTAQVIKSSLKCSNLDSEIINIVKEMKFEKIRHGITTIDYLFKFGKNKNSSALYYSKDDSIAAFKEINSNIAFIDQVKKTCTESERQNCSESQFRVTEMYFKAESKLNNISNKAYNDLHKQWIYDNRKNEEPASPAVKFDQAIGWHEKYLHDNPNGKQKLLIMYRLGYMYDVTGDEKASIQTMFDIEKTDSTYKNISTVYARIAEYYYYHHNYENALKYYAKYENVASEKMKNSFKEHENDSKEMVKLAK